MPVAASDAQGRARERERGPEDDGIDAGVHAALETLGCACDVVFRARRHAVLRKVLSLSLSLSFSLSLSLPLSLSLL